MIRLMAIITNFQEKSSLKLKNRNFDNFLQVYK